MALVALVALSGCKAAEERSHGEAKTGTQEKPAPEPPAEVGVPIDAASKTETAKSPPPSDDPLPAELEALAEMPELTAEATDAEIERRVDRFVEAVSAFFEVIAEHEDCGEMGRSLSRFVDINARFMTNLQSKMGDERFNQKVGKLLMARGNQWLAKVGQNLSRCAKHPAVLGALMKMSQQQAQQR